MANNQNRKRDTSKKSVLEQAMKRFNDSVDYQKTNWYEKWRRDNKLYDNERVNAQYHGVTDTFVPMTFGTVETMVAALNNARLRFDFATNDPLRQTSTAPLNALIDEWWDDDQWDLAFEESEREMFITGMAPFMMTWDGEHDRPHMEYGAMIDYIVDPTARNPYDLQRPGYYAGRRYFVRKGTLEDVMIVDTNPGSKTEGELVKRYKIKGESTAPVQDDDKANKDMFNGSTLATASDDQDEVIELWDIDRVVTIMNRQQVIEDDENPHKRRHRYLLEQEYQEGGMKLPQAKKRAERDATGLNPFFFFRNYRRSSLFYAKSEIDAISKLQENLNDKRNMESDTIIKSLARQRWLDPKYADWIDSIDEEPETVFPFDKDGMGFYDPPRVDMAAFNAQMNEKNEIRETTAIDQLAKGIANVRSTTATEVREQSANTSERIESKARILEKDGLYWMGYILFRLFQLYVDKPLVVEVRGKDADGLKTTVTLPDGIERQLPPGTALLDPADYKGTWRPKVTLELDAKAKKSDEMKEARESYTIMIQDPQINLAEARRIQYPKMFDLSKDEIDRILTAGPTAIQPGADPMSPIGGMTQDMAQPPAGPGAPPVDPAAMAQPAPAAPAQPLPDDVDAEALAQFLTPEEWQQLQIALEGAGVPA